MRYIAVIFTALLLVACSGGDGTGALPPTKPPVKPIPPIDPEEPVDPTEPTYNIRNVSSVEQLNSMAIVAGDMVILADGIYNDKRIDIGASGTVDKPIIIRAATAGKAIFTGSSRLMFSGSHILFEGFWFKDVLPSGGAVIEFRRSWSNVANNCAVKKCAITGYNTPTTDDEMVDYKWVSLFGSNNVVEQCSFADKRNMGALLVVWLSDESSSQAVRHKIRNNYFSRPKSILDQLGKAINGQETIRIGTSAFSMQSTECLVEGNVFYECNGEMEAVSNKSCRNTYRNNLFESCAATLTLRHGTDCVVEGNLFIGNDVANSGGVRIIDSNHSIKGNYMQNLKGTNYRAAISLIRGYANSEPSGYLQVQNCVVAENTIVDCLEGICANYGDSKMTMPVITTSIVNNLISNSNNTNTYVTIATLDSEIVVTKPDIRWSANVIYKGRAGSNVPLVGLDITTTQPPIWSRVQQIAAIKGAAGVAWSLK